LRRSIPTAIVRQVMTPTRSAWAFLILAVGIAALIFLPTSVAGCLGPLGVTGIEPLDPVIANALAQPAPQGLTAQLEEMESAR